MRRILIVALAVSGVGCGDNVAPQCRSDADCPGDPGCTTRTCLGGSCVVSSFPAGAPSAIQIDGDCKLAVCDGSGGERTQVDDNDIPAGATGACLVAQCTDGVPYAGPVQAGTACGTELYCDDAGACVGCLGASQCPAPPNACQLSVCLNETCGYSNVDAGTKLATQVKGDCEVAECDGNGAIEQVVDNTDLPVDGNPCTQDVCSDGVPSNPAQPAGTSCGTGMVCDGAGNCGQCNVPADCGADTECETHTCTGHVCGIDFTAADTPVSEQTPRDCQQNVCDGAGNITSIADDTDLPVDGNPCTDDVCTAGVPSNPPAASGTSCGPTTVCDGNGNCVGCTVASDCPGSDDDCETRTCTAGVCGLSFAAAGTPTSQQTAGDCQQNQCDGAGNTISAIDNSDVPVDGNPCTDDLCSAGVPSNPPSAAETSCNGDEVCDGNGSCVPCLIAADCGTATECVSYACAAQTCSATFASSGTLLADQTPGDCQSLECDGAGNTISVENDADIPVDGNACTGDVCTAGVPSNPALPDATVCRQSGTAGTRCRSAVCVPTLSIVRVGDGTAALASTATPVFVDEVYLDGTVVSQSALPVAASGANQPLLLSGTASSEGLMTRSVDEGYLVLAGYAAAAGAATIGTTRVVGRLDASRAIDTSTTFDATAFAGSNIRGAASLDGTAFWASGTASSGANGGTWYATLGQTAGGTQIESMPGNIRAIAIYGGQLYGSAGSGTFHNVFTIGSGLPTTGPQTVTSLPGMPTSTASPYAFVMFDLSASVPGLDTLYVADDTATGLQKWTFDGTTWTLADTFAAPGTSALRTVTGYLDGGNVVLLATTTATSANAVVEYVDDGTTTPSPITIVTAGTNTVYRGVALSPH